ncbi:MAG: methyltransferase domain-containing protein [Thermodesulfobacteriota bacterium]
MKKALLDVLCCPRCLPEERPLRLHAVEEMDSDVADGRLECKACGNDYPIRSGVAHLSPAPASRPGSRYESAPLLSSYLWSHYGDLIPDEEASDAYQCWAGLLAPRPGRALDIGCAVGRFCFEMAARCDLAVGVDSSVSFIRAARTLMQKGSLSFPLVLEGKITRPAGIVLPADWDRSRVEFVVADALALPFRSASFSSVAGLNLIDKLSLPLSHFAEVNRVAASRESQFLFSDPFSWSADSAAPEHWLGGTEAGPYSGRGLENVAAVLTGAKGGLQPAWRIEQTGSVRWKIRTHENHFELIKSRFIKAVR